MEAAPPRKKRLFCRYGPGSAAAVPRSGGAAGSRGPARGQDTSFQSDRCYFEAAGHCKYGASCSFRHAGGPQEGDEPQAPAGGDGPEAPCPLYQMGCCWFESTCWYAHVPGVKEPRLKLMLCAAFTSGGACGIKECPDAHSREELQVPRVFMGMPGYKATLCTFHVVDGAECKDELCFNAHGELELRRLALGVPRSLGGQQFFYSDSHLHLDHVLLSRKYGTYWFYKNQTCKRERCPLRSSCNWVHDEAERQERPLEAADLEALAQELRGLPGNFAGCVHSCCNAEDVDQAVRLVEWGRKALEGRVYASFGVHPSNFEEFTPELEAKLKAALEACGPQAVAWGECGLDYYRRAQDIEADPSIRTRMMDVFARQAHIAVRKGLPLVVHSRDADRDTIEVLRRVVPPTHPMHLHSFMGSLEAMEEFLERWPASCVGIAGAVTYDGSQYAGGLFDIVRALPLSRTLLETDGPYMAPMPYRGEESHPGHIPWIAEGVAQVKGVSTVEVLAAAHANFQRLYGV